MKVSFFLLLLLGSLRVGSSTVILTVPPNKAYNSETVSLPEKDVEVLVASILPESKVAVLLTANEWIYEEYIRNFTSGPKQVFKKNRKRNEFDLSPNRVKFNMDGTFWEINENREEFQGQWRLIENSTILETWIPGTHHHNLATIKLLTENRFEWHNEAYDTYGENIPAKVCKEPQVIIDVD